MCEVDINHGLCALRLFPPALWSASVCLHFHRFQGRFLLLTCWARRKVKETELYLGLRPAGAQWVPRSWPGLGKCCMAVGPRWEAAMLTLLNASWLGTLFCFNFFWGFVLFCFSFSVKPILKYVEAEFICTMDYNEVLCSLLSETWPEIAVWKRHVSGCPGDAAVQINTVWESPSPVNGAFVSEPTAPASAVIAISGLSWLQLLRWRWKQNLNACGLWPQGSLETHNKSKTEHTLNRKPKTTLLQLEAVFICSLGFESLILSFPDGKGWFQSQTQSAFWDQTSSETDPENCRQVCTVGPTRPSEGHFPVSLWWPRLAAHTSSCIPVLLRT